MSELTDQPAPISRFPTSVRNATFTTRSRGWDETEVRAYLDTLAEEIQAADADRAALRAEVERLRARRRSRDQHPDAHEAINAQVVGLFSQAQEVADSLVAEAVQRAQQMMATARAHEHEVRRRAQQAVDVESLHASTQRAQDQLRSVVAALNQQVERLDGVHESSAGLANSVPPLEPSHPLAQQPLTEHPLTGQPFTEHPLTGRPAQTPAAATTTVPAEPAGDDPSGLSDVGRYIRSSSEAFARSWEKSS